MTPQRPAWSQAVHHIFQKEQLGRCGRANLDVIDDTIPIHPPGKRRIGEDDVDSHRRAVTARRGAQGRAWSSAHCGAGCGHWAGRAASGSWWQGGSFSDRHHCQRRWTFGAPRHGQPRGGHPGPAVASCRRSRLPGSPAATNWPAEYGCKRLPESPPCLRPGRRWFRQSLGSIISTMARMM